MARFKLKYRTWIIIFSIIGLVGGASFAAVNTWSAELFPDQESAAQAQPGGPAAQRPSGQFAAAGAGGQAGQGTGAAATGAGARQAGVAGAAGQAGGGGTVGTVESLAGDTLTVTTQSGGSVKAQLSEQTTIQKRTPGSRETTPGSRADLTAGTRVMVQGPAGEDGTVTAQTIQVLPAGAGGQGRGGQRGGGGA